MKYLILCNGEEIAKFNIELYRNLCMRYLQDRMKDLFFEAVNLE